MRKWLIGLGIGAFLLCAGLCIWVGFLVRTPKIEIPPRQYPPNNAYESLRQIGLELDHLMTVDAQFKTVADKVHRQTASPSERRLYFERMEPFLREYRKHLDKPSVVIYEYSIDYPFTELSPFREIARAEALLIKEDLRNRRELSAVKRLDSLLQFSNKVRSEGPLIHHLVGIAISAIGLRPFQENTLQSQQALSALVQVAQRFEKERPPAWKTVREESVFVRAVFRDLASGKISYQDVTNPEDSPNAPKPFFSRIVNSALVNMALPEHRRLSEQAEQHFRLPYWERQKQPIPEPRQVLNAILFPTYRQFSQSETYELARVRLLGVMSAIRLHKLRTGRYPTTLVALNLGEMITDPFTGKPFVYRTDPRKGFLLYSLGPNGVDDGGAFPYGGHIDRGDIVPIYRPVPQNLQGVDREKRPLHPPVWLR